MMCMQRKCNPMNTVYSTEQTSRRQHTKPAGAQIQIMVNLNYLFWFLQVEKPSDIAAADKLIFPGVGTFGQAMDVLKGKGYIQPLVDHIQVR